MFEVPKSKKSIKQNQFHFKIEGREFSVPKIKYLTIAQVERLEDGGARAVLDVFSEDDAKVLAELDTEQFNALSQAWMEDSGISVGESSASEES